MPIKTVVITGVRGIRHSLTLELKGKSTLIHGDNGTGKSSIERALRWALTGQEEPDAQANWDTETGSRRHKLVKPDEPLVAITFTDGGAITVRPGTLEADSKGESHRIAVKKGMPFLRRTELLDVLKSKPVDRFEYFERFLGLDEVDSFLKDLGDEKASLERRKTDLTTKLSNNIDAIKPLLPHERQRNATSVQSLEREIIETVAGTTQLELGSWDAAAREIEAAFARLQTGDLEAKRQAAEAAPKEFSALEEKVRTTPPWTNEREAHLTSVAAGVGGSDVLDLLDHAIAHFRAAEGEFCPVCEQPIDWRTTRDRLEARRRGLSEYADLVRARSEAFRTLVILVSSVADAITRVCHSTGIAVPESPRDLTGILEARTRGSDAEELAARGVGSEAILGSLKSWIHTATENIANELIKMPATGREPAVRLARALVKRFGDVRPQLHLLDTEAAHLTHELGHLATVHDSLRRARQDVAGEVLRAIGQTVERYYVLIHPRDLPDEATGAPSIEVQRHGRGTAFVRGRFENAPIKDPTWVYSDGHLDTVGICVFLALRRLRANEKSDAKLLVLDDIVLSIDLGHARRLIELLRTEFADHQILIFTHNGLFAYWCKHLLPSVERMRITSWSLEGGPTVGDLETAGERLEAVMARGDSKEIAMHIKALMDEWCAEARYAYTLAVPARFEEQYTLSDIWHPLVRKLKELSKELGSDLGGAVPILERIRDLPAMRNALAAHENEFAREYPRQVVAETAKDVLLLSYALRCSKCGTFAVRPASSAVVACKCGGIAYTKKRSE